MLLPPLLFAPSLVCRTQLCTPGPRPLLLSCATSPLVGDRTVTLFPSSPSSAGSVELPRVLLLVLPVTVSTTWLKSLRLIVVINTRSMRSTTTCSLAPRPLALPLMLVTCRLMNMAGGLYCICSLAGYCMWPRMTLVLMLMILTPLLPLCGRGARRSWPLIGPSSKPLLPPLLCPLL